MQFFVTDFPICGNFIVDYVEKWRYNYPRKGGVSLPTTRKLTELEHAEFKRVLNRILKHFTLHDIDVFTELVDEFIFSPRKSNTRVHISFPQLLFVVRTISDFSQAYILPDLVGVEDERYSSNIIYINNMRTAITLELYRRLSDITNDLPADFITALSGESYEGSATKNYTLAIVPKLETDPKHPEQILFDENQQITLEIEHVHAIRKQLNMTDDAALAIYKDYKTGLFHTIGLIPTSVAKKYPRFYFSSRSEWFFCVPSHRVKSSSLQKKTRRDISSIISSECRIHYHRGQLLFPDIDLSEVLLNKVYSIFIDYDKSTYDAKQIVRIIQATKDCAHGAVLIFADKDFISAEATRLAQNGACGMLLNPGVKLFDKDHVVPTFWRLTSIDGALLVDLDGVCHACGVILDGQRTLPGKPSRGARYNSTKAYVESANDFLIKPTKATVPILAVVQSEDGMQDIFQKLGEISK